MRRLTTDTRVLSGLRNLADSVIKLLDVAGVYAHRSAASIDGLEDILGLKVNVRDDRYLALLRNDGKSVRVIPGRNSHTHNVTACGGEFSNLLECSVDVGGLSGRHRLHADLVLTSDHHLPDFDLSGLTTRAEGFRDFG